MNSWLESFKRYKQDRKEILQKVNNLSEKEFHELALDGGWSVQQLLNHLIEIEELTFEIVKKSCEEKTWKTVGFKKKFYSFMLNRNLKSKKKFMIPEVLNHPENNISKKDILEKWKSVQLNSQKVLSEFNSHNKKKGVFKHPSTGWLNISQTISFLRFHQYHHLRQLDTKLSELS